MILERGKILPVFVVTLAFLVVLAGSCSRSGYKGPCGEVDCSGHGDCAVGLDGIPGCICDPGYQADGVECVPNATSCAGVECSGHGECYMSGPVPACRCDAGYQPEGLTCVAVENPCGQVDCSGHGSCVENAAGQAICICEQGYHNDGFTVCVSDLGGPCTEAADCDDSNPCTEDACNASNVCSNLPAQGACDDQDDCTQDDSCSGGLCTGDARDADGDSYADEACGGEDCNDADATVNPGASEGPLGDPTCEDSLDNDCDGAADLAEQDCRSWELRRLLTFDNSAQPDDLTDFPLPLRLDARRIDYDRAQPGGADLLFIDDDLATVLAHEIEVWDPAGTSVVWVRVPNIPAQATDDHIWMYYGNPAAQDAQDPPGVWDDKFRGVWHLAETVGSNARDSSARGFDIFYIGAPSLAMPGGFGDLAVLLDGVDDHMELGNLDIYPYQGSNGVTLEVYARPDGVQAQGLDSRLISKEYNPAYGPCNGECWLIRADGGQRLLAQFSAGTGEPAISGGSLAEGQWFYAAFTFDGSRAVLYADGLPVDSHAVPDHSIDVEVGAQAWIGANPYTSSERWTGPIGEVRISTIARSASWIHAQQQAMSDEFVTFGEEEEL